MVLLSRRNLLSGAGLVAGTWLGSLLLQAARRRAPPLLRPPGALEEDRFLAACIRCAQCIEACPIQVLHMARMEAGVSPGTPCLKSREKPCNLCQGREELECIAACPTGALKPVAGIRGIRMGTAVIDEEVCLPFHGVACRACWHACPLPGEAIHFDERGRPEVRESACIGCGLCEHACLAEPAAIRVRPARASGST